jgi:hypothetical protein
VHINIFLNFITTFTWWNTKKKHEDNLALGESILISPTINNFNVMWQNGHDALFYLKANLPDIIISA